MTQKPQKSDLNRSLKQLRDIVSWFDSQTEIDIEVGLTKIKEASVHIKDSKERLRQLENEFIEIKKKLSDDDQ